MNCPIPFTPEVNIIGTVEPTHTIAELDGETGVFSATPNFVRDNCGPIANDLVDNIEKSGFFDETLDLGFYPNIDVRVHRLYPGDIPANPGWHTDGEYRKDYHAQPDLGRWTRHAHVIGHVSTGGINKLAPEGISRTEIVTTPFTAEIEDPSSDNPLWRQVHWQVETNRDQLTTIRSNDGELVRLGAMTLHQAREATIRGWRLFVRASMWHKPPVAGTVTDGGSISKQEIVYRMATPGW